MDFKDYKEHFRKFDDFNDRHGKNNPHKHNDNYYFDEINHGEPEQEDARCHKAEVSAVAKEWKIGEGRKLGYDTGDKKHAFIDFDICTISVTHDPYREGNDEYNAEIDFNGGFSDVKDDKDLRKVISWLESYTDELPELTEEQLLEIMK